MQNSSINYAHLCNFKFNLSFKYPKANTLHICNIMLHCTDQQYHIQTYLDEILLIVLAFRQATLQPLRVNDPQQRAKTTQSSVSSKYQGEKCQRKGNKFLFKFLKAADGKKILLLIDATIDNSCHIIRQHTAFCFCTVNALRKSICFSTSFFKVV